MRTTGLFLLLPIMLNSSCANIGIVHRSHQQIPSEFELRISQQDKPDAEVSGKLTFPGDVEFSSWTPPDTFTMPSVRLQRLELGFKRRPGRDSPLKIYTEFSFIGDASTNRQMLVDLKLFNKQKEVIHHDWSIQDDGRLRSDMEPGPSKMGCSDKLNSVKFEMWHEILPSVAAVEIRFREMYRNDLRHFPPAPQKLDLGITEPDEKGNFNVSFCNPDGLRVDPSQHGIVVSLVIRNAQWEKIDKILKYYDAKPMSEGDRYGFAFQIDPQFYDYSSLGVTFYTKQPDNEAFLQKFFVEGKGSGYSGTWRGDGGELWRIPLESFYKKRAHIAEE